MGRQTYFVTLSWSSTDLPRKTTCPRSPFVSAIRRLSRHPTSLNHRGLSTCITSALLQLFRVHIWLAKADLFNTCLNLPSIFLDLTQCTASPASVTLSVLYPPINRIFKLHIYNRHIFNITTPSLYFDIPRPHVTPLVRNVSYAA